MTIKNEFDKTPESVLEKEVQGQKPKILMVGADGHFKELSYEVVHDGNLLVHPSNFAQEQEIVRSCRNCKYSDCSSYVEPCFSCEGSTAEWEPKP